MTTVAKKKNIRNPDKLMGNPVISRNPGKTQENHWIMDSFRKVYFLKKTSGNLAFSRSAS